MLVEPHCTLQQYGHVEIVKELNSIEEKIPKDINGRTPIHLAASRGHLEVIKFFAPLAKSELFSKDSDGLTPLRHAHQGEHTNVINYLISVKKKKFQAKE